LSISNSTALVEAPPDGDGWLHEIKYDGSRTELLVESGKGRAFTWRGFDWTDKYGPIAERAAKLPVKSAVIGGGVIVMNDAGVSDFGALRSAMRRPRSAIALDRHSDEGLAGNRRAWPGRELEIATAWSCRVDHHGRLDIDNHSDNDFECSKRDVFTGAEIVGCDEHVARDFRGHQLRPSAPLCRNLGAGSVALTDRHREQC
jgi:hypothetical protein